MVLRGVYLFKNIKSCVNSGCLLLPPYVPYLVEQGNVTVGTTYDYLLQVCHCIQRLKFFLNDLLASTFEHGSSSSTDTGKTYRDPQA